MSDLIDKLVADLKPVQILKTSNLVLRFCAGAAASVFLILLTLGLRENLQQGNVMLPMFWKVGTFFLFAVVFIRALISESIPGRKRDSFDHFILVAALGALFIPAFCVLYTQPLAYILLGLKNPTTLYCLGGVALSTLPGLALALLWVRQAKPLKPEKCFILAGTAMGALGTFAYALHCNQDHPIFVLVCYSTAMILPAVLAKFMAPLFLLNRNHPPL